MFGACSPDSPSAFRGHVHGAVLALAALCTASHAAAQQQLWLDQFGTNASESAEAAAPDGAGGVFFAGSTGSALFGPSAGQGDVWLTRHDAFGAPLWQKQFGSSASEAALGAASDGAGGVYLAGYTVGALGGPNAGSHDAWLARFDATGQQFWIRQIGTSAEDFAYVVAPDGAGGAYVAGDTSGPLGGLVVGPVDSWLARYDAARALRRRRHPGLEDPDRHGHVRPDLRGRVRWRRRHLRRRLHLRRAGQRGVERHPGLAGALRPHGRRALAASVRFWHPGAPPSVGPRRVRRRLCRWDHAGLPVRDLPGRRDLQRCLARALRRRGQLHLGRAVRDLRVRVPVRARAGRPRGIFAGGTTEGDLAASHRALSDVWIGRWTDVCPPVATYCTASGTSIPGCSALLSTTGAPELHDPQGFTIQTSGVPAVNVGLCLFAANGPASLPFGTLGGVLCVQPPAFRSAAKSSGGGVAPCDGSYSFTLQNLIDAAPIVTLGTTIHAQVWARDPVNADGFLLSNAVEFSVCP